MTNLTKTIKSGCCGTYHNKKKPKVIENIPDNPKVAGGIAVIYVGSGYIKIDGAQSGFTYHASDHNRHFAVAHEDIDFVMKTKDIIYKP